MASMTSGVAVLMISVLASALIVRGQEAEKSSVTVDQNTQVSTALSQLPHFEIASCVNPSRPSQMLVGSMFLRANRIGVAVYRSTDNGKNWTLSFTTEADLSTAADPTCTFDGRGNAYFVVGGKEDVVDSKEEPIHRLLVYRSKDDGQTWTSPLRLPFIDREWITVMGKGQEGAQILIHGTGAVRQLGIAKPVSAMAAAGTVLTMLSGTVSEDGERFERLESGFAEGSAYIIGMGNGVTLPDGGVGVIFGSVNDRTATAAKSESIEQTLYFARLPRTGGGWTGIQKVGRWLKYTSSSGTQVPQLAIDTSQSPFKNTLYAVWPDRRSGRVRIMLARSKDAGATWTEVGPVDDEPVKSDPNQQAELANPAVAVNRFGVVAVSWLDRRGDARNLDWDYRIAVSVDGGETFSRSVVVSSEGSHFGGNEDWPLNVASAGRSEAGDVQLNVTLNGFFDNIGHTVSMTADEEGAFHPVWADNRTGRPQLWTTTVHVAGKGQSFEAETGLQDVSKSVTVEILSMNLDRRTNVLTAVIRFKNEGRASLTSRVLAKIRDLSSKIGTPHVLDSVNGMSEIGAVLDLSDMLGGPALEPGKLSKEKTLKFRIDHPDPFVADQPWLMTYNLLSLRLGLYAVVEPR